MTRFLLTLGVLFALLAVFTLPTAQASMTEFNTTMTLDQLDAVAIQADDSGGSQFAELDAKQGPQFDEMACRPLRGLLRGVGKGLRGVGRGIRHVLHG